MQIPLIVLEELVVPRVHQYIPLPSYAPGFYMPEASADAVKEANIVRHPDLRGKRMT